MKIEITIRVVSNVDHLQSVEWPNLVSCRPEIGDHIYSKDHKIRAKITAITHDCKKVYGNQLEPILEIEVWQQPIQ